MSRLGRLQSRHLLWTTSGLLLWSFHFVAMYVLLSLACAAGLGVEKLGGFYLVNLALLGMTILMLAIILVMGAAAWRYWRVHRRETARDPTQRNEVFLALLAVLIHGIATVAMLWGSLPLLFTVPC